MLCLCRAYENHFLIFNYHHGNVMMKRLSLTNLSTRVPLCSDNFTHGRKYYYSSLGIICIKIINKQ